MAVALMRQLLLFEELYATIKQQSDPNRPAKSHEGNLFSLKNTERRPKKTVKKKADYDHLLTCCRKEVRYHDFKFK